MVRKIRIHRLFILISTLLFVPGVSFGQAIYRAGIFGGYSYLDGDFEKHREQAHGWAASIQVNINRSFSVVADYSGHYKHSDFLAGADPESRTYISTFLFGPRFISKGEKVRAFAHALAGGRNLKLSGFSDTDFAVGLGGGIDYQYNKRLGLRVFQIDYIPTRSEENWAQNFRAEFGLVFNFGKQI